LIRMLLQGVDIMQIKPSASIEDYIRKEKILKLKEELLTVEEYRLAGCAGVTSDELDRYLESIIDEVKQ